MSVAAAQAQKFYEQVSQEGVVFTFTSDGSFLVFPISGQEIIPFWSSRSRLDRIQRTHLKYRDYESIEIALPVFLTSTLPDLRAGGISVGVNWSGPRLTGYDLPVDDLIANLNYWIARVGT